MRQLILLIILFLSGNPLLSQNENEAVRLFDRAYKIEKEDPDTAIEYYTQALQSGLKPELRRVALWRLHFLYLEKKNFIRAWDVFLKIPNRNKTAENKFFDELASYTKTGRQEFLQLYSSLKENRIYEVKSYFKTAHPMLKYEILDFYSEKNLEFLEELAKENFSDHDPVNTKLFLANYFLERNKHALAENFLIDVSTSYSEELSPTYKENILYLLGKIKREKKPLESISYFLLAANYSPTSRDYERQISLAMFSLYRSGYKEVAYEFEGYIRNIPADPMQRLFLYLIRAEKEPTTRNLEELRKLTLQIKENTFLVEKAKELLQRHDIR